MSRIPIEDARDNAEWLMSLNGIVGLGIDDTPGEERIMIFVSGRLAPQVQEQIPPTLDGWPWQIDLTLDIDAKKEVQQ